MVERWDTLSGTLTATGATGDLMLRNPIDTVPEPLTVTGSEYGP